MEQTLSKMERTLEEGKETYSEDLISLLENRLQICHNLLQDLRDYLKSLSPELEPTWEKLVSILRSTSAANTKSKESQAGSTANSSIDIVSLTHPRWKASRNSSMRLRPR